MKFVVILEKTEEGGFENVGNGMIAQDAGFTGILRNHSCFFLVRYSQNLQGG